VLKAAKPVNNMMLVEIGIIFCCLTSIHSTPIISPLSTQGNQDFGISLKKGFCYIPREYSGKSGGEAKFLEDCATLGEYRTVPKPEEDQFYYFGVHPVVCCPGGYPTKKPIFFPTDPQHEDYVVPSYDYDYEGGADYGGEGADYGQYAYAASYDAGPPIAQPEVPKIADDFCPPGFDLPGFGLLSQCVAINQCSELLNNANAPLNQTLPCGFDKKQSMMKICCPTAYVTQPQDIKQSPRFPDRSGKPRKVEDKTNECIKWSRNYACELDRDFNISTKTYFDPVKSATMFGFMQKACMKTCRWAPEGCYDEHERCQEWARAGLCALQGYFMAHTCRESCGVCGFLAPDNKDEQIVDGKSYSDHNQNNFDCGRYKLLKDLNGGVEENNEEPETLNLRNEEIFRKRRQTDESEEDFVFYFSGDKTDSEAYFCGGTIINDRWVLTAAHCYDDLNEGVESKAREIQVNTIRDGTPFKESIERKKIYKHPNYVYQRLYDDIALVELGRRISYNFDKVR